MSMIVSRTFTCIHTYPATRVIPKPCPSRVRSRLVPAHATTTVTEVLTSRDMKPYQIERLQTELDRKALSVEWLETRVAELEGVVGQEAPLAAMLYNGGVELLEQDPAKIASQLIVLKEALPGISVMDMASKEPRILWAPDLSTLCQKVLKKLVQIYPYKSKDKKADVIKVLAEAPELLFRMGYYCEDKIKKVQDLPIDLQNRILRSYC